LFEHIERFATQLDPIELTALDAVEQRDRLDELVAAPDRSS